MHCDQTVEELSDSITGFDEIAIKKAFGTPFAMMGAPETGDPFQFLRSLVFVQRRREGDNDITAYHAAQGLTSAAVNAFFAEDSAESGKDNSEPEQTPTSSQPGASTPDSQQLPGSN
jgi:hypothetical protein